MRDLVQECGPCTLDLAWPRSSALATQSKNSEARRDEWRKPSMQEQYVYEKQYLYGRRCPIPSSCGATEALLLIELLGHLPQWLSKKGTVLGCMSSCFCVAKRYSRMRMLQDLAWLRSYTWCLPRCPSTCISSRLDWRTTSPNWLQQMRPEHTLNHAVHRAFSRMLENLSSTR